MLNIREKPYQLLLITAIGISLVMLFLLVNRFENEEISMFGVPLGIFGFVIPLILIVFWGLYMLSKRILYSNYLTWTHVLISISTTILTVNILFFVINPMPSTLSPDYAGNDKVEITGNFLRFLFLFFVVGQITFLVNVLIGFFRVGR